MFDVQYVCVVNEYRVNISVLLSHILIVMHGLVVVLQTFSLKGFSGSRI